MSNFEDGQNYVWHIIIKLIGVGAGLYIKQMYESLNLSVTFDECLVTPLQFGRLGIIVIALVVLETGRYCLNKR